MISTDVFGVVGVCPVWYIGVAAQAAALTAPKAVIAS
jgi:hypothetical protein